MKKKAINVNNEVSTVQWMAGNNRNKSLLEVVSNIKLTKDKKDKDAEVKKVKELVDGIFELLPVPATTATPAATKEVTASYIVYQMLLLKMSGDKRITDSEKKVVRAFEQAYPADAERVKKVLKEVVKIDKAKKIDTGTLKEIASCFGLADDAVFYMDYQLARLRNPKGTFVTQKRQQEMLDFEQNFPEKAELARKIAEKVYDHKEDTELTLTDVEKKIIESREKVITKFVNDLYPSDQVATAYANHQLKVKGMLGGGKPTTKTEREAAGEFERRNEKTAGAINRLVTELKNIETTQKLTVQALSKIAAALSLPDGAVAYMDCQLKLIENPSVTNVLSPAQQAMINSFEEKHPTEVKLAGEIVKYFYEHKVEVIKNSPKVDDESELGKLRARNREYKIEGKQLTTLKDEVKAGEKELKQQRQQFRVLFRTLEDCEQALDEALDNMLEQFPDEFSGDLDSYAAYQIAASALFAKLVAQDKADGQEIIKIFLQKYMDYAEQADRVEANKSKQQELTAAQDALRNSYTAQRDKVRDLAITADEHSRMLQLITREKLWLAFKWGVLPILVGALVVGFLMFGPFTLPATAALVLGGMAVVAVYGAMVKQQMLGVMLKKTILKLGLSAAVMFITDIIPFVPRIKFDFNFDPRSSIASKVAKRLAPFLLMALLGAGISFPISLAVVVGVTIIAYVAIRYFGVEKIFNTTAFGRATLGFLIKTSEFFDRRLDNVISACQFTAKKVAQGVNAIIDFLFNKANKKLALDAHKAVREGLGLKSMTLPVWGDEIPKNPAMTRLQQECRKTWEHTSSSLAIASDDQAWLSLRREVVGQISTTLGSAILSLGDSKDPTNKILQTMLIQTRENILALKDHPDRKKLVARELLALYEALDSYKLKDGLYLSQIARDDPGASVIMRELDKMLGVSEESRQLYTEYKIKHTEMLTKLQGYVAILRERFVEETDEAAREKIENQILLCDDAINFLQESARVTDKPLSAADYDESVSWLTESSGLALSSTKSMIRVRAQELKDKAAAIHREDTSKNFRKVSDEVLKAELQGISAKLQQSKHELSDVANVFSVTHATHYTVSRAGNDIDLLCTGIEWMQQEEDNMLTKWTWFNWFPQPHSELAIKLQQNSAVLREAAIELDDLEHDVVLMKNEQEKIQRIIDRIQRALKAEPPQQAEADQALTELKERCLLSESLPLRDPGAKRVFGKITDEIFDQCYAVKNAAEQWMVNADQFAEMVANPLEVLQVSLTAFNKTMQVREESHPIVVRLHILAINMHKMYDAMTPEQQQQHQHVKQFFEALDTVLNSGKGFDDKDNRQAVLQAYERLQKSSVKKEGLGNRLREFVGMGEQVKAQTPVVVKQHGPEQLEKIAKPRALVEVESEVDQKAEAMLINIMRLQASVEELQGLEQSLRLKLVEPERAPLIARLERLVEKTDALLAKLAVFEVRLKKREDLSTHALSVTHAQLQRDLTQQINQIQQMIHIVAPETLEEALTAKPTKPAVKLEDLSLEELLSGNAPLFSQTSSMAVAQEESELRKRPIVGVGRG